MPLHSLILAAALAAAPALADSEARQGSDWVRFTAQPCAHAQVLAHIPEADRADYRAARAEIGGKAYAACWRPLFERRAVWIVYEDGDGGYVPFGAMQPVREL